MNHKNARIAKLVTRGLTDPARIAKKTGLPVARVVEGLASLRRTREIAP